MTLRADLCRPGVRDLPDPRANRHDEGPLMMYGLATAVAKQVSMLGVGDDEQEALL